jgi:hypothetical protein
MMPSNNHAAYLSSMDDLVLVGAFSIIALYAAAVLSVVAAGAVLWEFRGAAVAGDTGRIAAIIAIVLVFLVMYTGAGLWLQKSGRI